MRSGKASACAIGVRMSGLPSCASTDAVNVLDHRMDDALRMDHDLDRSRADAEQPVRLDHLEPLVHHRRRVDGDLAAHHPVRVRARFVRRDLREIRQRRACGTARPTRSAGCGARRPRAGSRAYAGGRHWKIALCSLSIGSSVAPPASTARHEHRAADHQRFLVGEQHALAGARGRERGCRPAAPTIAAITVSASASVAASISPAVAGEDARRQTLARQAPARARAPRRVEQRGDLRPVATAQRDELLPLPVRGERGNLEAIRMARDHVERRVADRAGRAEER